MGRQRTMENNEIFKMNTQTQEALKMAIKGLLIGHHHKDLCDEAVNACKEALAECEQAEPVAWIKVEEGFARPAFRYKFSKDKKDGFTPLYTIPPDQTAEIERLKEREQKLVEAVNKLNDWVFEVAPDDYRTLISKEDVIELIKNLEKTNE